MTNSKELIKNVETRVQQMQLHRQLDVPSDYSAANAIRGAQLILQSMRTKNGRPVLEACTQTSIANALMRMVTEGLSPLKRQGSFICRGDELTWQREYAGTIALARRNAGLKGQPKACLIFKGDKVELAVKDGVTTVVNHEKDFSNLAGEILGAYCVVKFKEEPDHHEIMTMKEIQAAWNMGSAKGASPAHKEFPGEMAKKTVINRALKNYINSSDDAAIMGGFHSAAEGGGVEDEFVELPGPPDTKNSEKSESAESPAPQEISESSESKEIEESKELEF